MGQVAREAALVCFGVYEIDLRSGELRKAGVRIKVQELPLKVLAALLEHPGEVVSREDLRKRIWPEESSGDFDHAVNVAVGKLRVALGDSSESPHVIETIPRRGYRFIALVKPSGEMVGAGRVTENISPPHSGSGSAFRQYWLFLGLLVVALLAISLAYEGIWRRYSSRNNIHSLAVLPLRNLSGDPNQDYFADGMTDELITSLAKIRSLRVTSHTSTMQFGNTQAPLPEIAQRLKVDTVLEGTVVRSGDKVRITVQLIDGRSDRHLWAESYERDLRDVLGLQGEIARTVTDEIKTKVTPEERTRLSNARPVNPEAHADYLRGRSLLVAGPAHLSKVAGKGQYTEQDIRTAIAYFRQAIENDPNYAMAYAGLADAYLVLGHPAWGGVSPKETISEARAAATKALELDPSLGEAHLSLAQIFELYDWNWPEAEREYQLALKLNPNDAGTHLEYGRFVQALGRNDEALSQMNYAVELDPFNVRVKETMGYVTYASRQYDLAIKQFEVLGDDFGLGWAYREKKMYPEAIAALQRSASRSLQNASVLGALAGVYGLDGRRAEALKLIDELKVRDQHHRVSRFFFAEAYAGFGDKEQALTWLERAYEDRDQFMVFINSYPGLDPLRREPRFQALLLRMNFPQ